MKTVEIYGRVVEVKVGSCVRPDGWRFASRLIESDWSKCEFRLPTNSDGPITSLAVNVVVTGRTVQYRECDYWVRCRIEFVGDGEPSTFSSGWIKREW